ncbi:MAG: hypothetical protein IKX66_01180, partial [Clostridia bacterium]|nr:hypothetical protein [Clostridia bacterium]
MQNASVKKNLLPAVLIVAAALALVLTLLFAFRGSADEPQDEIQDLRYQTVSGDTLGSANTSLRFLFTVGSLDFDSVGFVLSKTNTNPKIGGDGCKVKEASSVHSAVWANGELIQAGAGRWWVALKVTGIDNLNFDTTIYVKPFVEDDEGIRYGETHALSATGAFTIPTLRNQIKNDFGGSDFGTGSIRADLGGSYAVPAQHPTTGQHPRVLFTSESIDGLNDALVGAKSVAQSGYAAALASPPDGEIANDAYDSDDTAILRDIQTLALDYRMTGNPLSGFRAIYAIKNVLKTLTDSWTGNDDVAHRYYGYAMYITACVYDWCYDLLTATDKQQIVLGVQEKICKVGMTVNYAVGFPPTRADAVSGHGTSFGILRDYLAFAIAIYDEYPGWWNMIAGRFYEEYVPVRNQIYEAGMIPQGVSLYVRSKYFPELFSAWLVKAATGVFPYASEANMKQIARTIFSYELRVNNSTLYGFASGDDQTPYGVFLDYGHIALISSYLFNDATMRAQLEHNYQSGGNPTNLPYGSSYRNFSGDITETASIAEYLICSSSGLEPAADRHEGMDLILY